MRVDSFGFVDGVNEICLKQNKEGELNLVPSNYWFMYMWFVDKISEKNKNTTMYDDVPPPPTCTCFICLRSMRLPVSYFEADAAEWSVPVAMDCCERI